MHESIISSNINLLIKNLMDEPEEEKYKTENSVKRENIISQLLIDKFDMCINNEDNIFLRERVLAFIDVTISKKNTVDEMKKEPIETTKVLVTKGAKTKKLILNGKNYEIGFKNYFYIKHGDKYCKLINEQSSTKDSESNSISSNKSRKTSKSGILSNPYVPKIFHDVEKNIFIMLIQRDYEFDGTLKSKTEISILKELKEILFFPQEAKDIKIGRGERILLEVKQNATLKSIYAQMKKNMQALSELIPDKKFFYFGFVKDSNYNKDENNNIIDENQFKKSIENDMKNFENIKFFLFIVKNNKLFDFSLDEQINYGVHSYNLLKKEMDIIKKEINEQQISIKKEINEQQISIKKEINEQQIQLKGLEKKIQNIESILSEISSSIKTKQYNNNSRYYNRNNNNYYYRRGNYRRGNYRRGNYRRGRGDNYYKKKYYYNYENSYYY